MNPVPFILLAISLPLLLGGCGEKTTVEPVAEVQPVEEKVMEVKEEAKTEEPVAETKQVEEKQQEAEREKKREQMLQARFSRGLSNNDSKRRVRLPPPRGYKGKTDNSRKEAKKREGVNLEELEEREGIMYLKGSDTPYTGKRFTLYEFGKKKKEVNFKDGKKDGLQMWWHENGQKRHEENYKDGKLHGLDIGWHENGQKMRESNWKDGKRISRKYWNSKGEPVDSLGETRK